jgi:hypothetical protein
VSNICTGEMKDRGLSTHAWTRNKLKNYKISIVLNYENKKKQASFRSTKIINLLFLLYASEKDDFQVDFLNIADYCLFKNMKIRLV